MRQSLSGYPLCKVVRPIAAAMLVDMKPVADFFEEAVSELATMDEKGSAAPAKQATSLLFNYLTSDLLGLVSASGGDFQKIKIKPEGLAHLADLINDGKIMSRQAKEILRKMFETGEDPEAIMRDEGLETVSDQGEVADAVREVIAANPKAAADFKKGREASLKFLLGQAMAKLRGRGDPEQIREILHRTLSE